MPKTVNLTVHKNTVERRRKSGMSRDLVRHVRNMTRENDVRAYAVIGIASDGRGLSVWDSGGVMPLWAFAETMGSLLREDVQPHVESDDWKPALHRSKSEAVD